MQRVEPSKLDAPGLANRSMRVFTVGLNARSGVTNTGSVNRLCIPPLDRDLGGGLLFGAGCAPDLCKRNYSGSGLGQDDPVKLHQIGESIGSREVQDSIYFYFYTSIVDLQILKRLVRRLLHGDLRGKASKVTRRPEASETRLGDMPQLFAALHLLNFTFHSIGVSTCCLAPPIQCKVQIGLQQILLDCRRCALEFDTNCE